MPQVEKNKSNLIQCRCKFCPSYPLGCLIKASPQMAKIFLTPGGAEKEAHVENLFCAFGSSNCIKDKKGCKCPGCPVHKKYNLEEVYYCLGA
jgi:hypothetical protein